MYVISFNRMQCKYATPAHLTESAYKLCRLIDAIVKEDLTTMNAKC